MALQFKFNALTGTFDLVNTGGSGGGQVNSVVGTANRVVIDSTDPANPIVNISSVFEALLGKVASPLSQFAATTSSQLAGVISDETGSGSLVFGTAPTLSNPVVGTQSPGDNSTKAASTAFVADAITTAVIGLLDYRGSYDASGNVFPSSGGSGVAGAILKGDFWICSVAGTLGGVAVTPGDLIIAIVDTPGQTAANWSLIAHDLGSYVTSITGTTNQVIASASTGAVALSLPSTLILPGSIQTTGNSIFTTDNTYDIGASGATRPRTLYIGTSVIAPAGTAGAPAYTFDAGTGGIGMYRIGNGLGLATGSNGNVGFAVSGGAVSFLSFTGSNTSATPVLNVTTGSARSGSSAAQVFASLTPTYNQTSTAGATDFLINRTETAVGSGAQILIDAQVASSSKFKVFNTGHLLLEGVTSTGATGTGNIVFNTSPTIALASASTATTQSPNDNSTKIATTAYVDNAVLGQNFKEAAIAATTANLVGVYVSGVFTFTATGTNTIDGVTLALGNRVLVKNQTTTFQNGIYSVTTAGALGIAGVLTRTTDANQSNEFKTGDSLFVTSGTTQSATTWAYTGADSPTIGTDSITYVQVAGQGSFTSGNGITITGNSIAIDTSVTVDKTTAQTLTNKTLTSPILTTPALGTPASGNMSNTTNIPVAQATGLLPAANMTAMTATVGGSVPTPPNNTTTFLRGDGTFAAPSGGAKAFLTYATGGQTIGSSGTFYFGIGSLSATESFAQNVCPVSGTIKNLYFVTSGSQGANGSLVLTLQKNGVAQTVVATCAANAAAGTFSDTTHSFTVAAGDLISIKGVNNHNGLSASVITFSWEVDPT